MRAEYTDEPFEVAIVGEDLICIWPDGAKLKMPIDVVRINMARCAAAIAMHDHTGADVVPIKRGRKKPT